jgi:cell division septal protein FtsQ
MSKTITVSSPAELESVVSKYALKGFTVTAQNATRAVLYKKKEFSILMAILGFLFCVIGLVVYALIYSAKNDEAIEVVVSSGDEVVSAQD